MKRLGLFSIGLCLAAAAALIGCKRPAPYGYSPGPNSPTSYSTEPVYVPRSGPSPQNGSGARSDVPASRFDSGSGSTNQGSGSR